MTKTLLVTNDFPPKVGGIQSYLEELWRRLDPSMVTVLTASSHRGAAAYDADALSEGRHVERVRGSTLYVPTPRVRRAIDAAVERTRPDLVLYDPYVPLAMAGRRRGLPYGVVLHGAEVAIPARLPAVRRLRARVLRDAAVVVSAGSYPEDEARRLAGDDLPRSCQVPPGVDATRFVPLDPDAARRAPAARAPRRRRARGLGRHGSCRERASTCSSRPSRDARVGSRRHRSRSQVTAATRRACDGIAARLACAGAVPRPGEPRPTRSPCSGAPTSSPSRAARGGAASSRRASGSSSSKRPPAGCPRWPGARAGPSRPWPRARPASSSTSQAIPSRWRRRS